MKAINVISYTANVIAIAVIAALCLRAPSDKGANGRAAATTAVPASKLISQHSAAAVSSPVPWASANMESVVAALKQLGAPPEVIADIIRTLLMRKYNDLRNNLMHPPGSAKWTLHNPVRTPEVRQKLADLGKSFDAEMRQLLGADYEKTTLDKEQAVIMPDGLSAEKRAKLADMAYDYAAARRNVGPGISKEAEEKINAQYVEDLKQVLSPSELHDYLAYNSSLASSLQQRLGGATIDDQTYMKLYDGLSAYREAHAAESGSSRIPSSFTYQAGEFDLVRSTVGDDAAAAMALRSDASFRQVAQIITPQDDPSAVAGKYEEWLQFHAAIEGLEKNPPSQDELVAQRAAVASNAYAKLTANLSDSAKARFNMTPLGGYMQRLMKK